MERNCDEVIAEMLIQLAQIERNLEKENSRMEAFDKRMALTIKQMVRVEERLGKSDDRMSLFDQKLNRSLEQLEQSLNDHREFSAMQSRMNNYFIDYIDRNTQQG